MEENTNEEVPAVAEKIVIGDRYLRRRPFLVVNVTERPTKGARTEKVKPPMEKFEQPTIVDSVSNKHLREAQVIIDILNRVAVKNRFVDVASNEQIAEHYLAKFAAIVAEGVTVWARRNGMSTKT